MTGIELADGLRARLSVLFTGYSLLNKSGVMQEIKIFNQYVPQPSGVTVNTKGLANYSAGDYDSNFPSIIIQLKESIYQEERMIAQAVHKVTLLIGIYDEASECQGWRDIANIEDRIINNLLVDRVIANKFRLEMPITFRYVDVDVWPIYLGEVELSFQIGRAFQRHNYIHEVKGDYI